MVPLAVLVPVGLVVVLFVGLLWNYSYWYRRGVPQGNPLKLFSNDFTLSRESYLTLYTNTYKYVSISTLTNPQLI